MYPSGLTITPEPRPCSVCLPCLCGARPPKNWRNPSSENENPVCPRETVCVVDTVTTLGATFSTSGAKVVTIPSRVCCGCSAMTGDRLVFTHKTVSANRPHDLRIPFSINSLLAEKNRTHSRSWLFFDLVSRWNLNRSPLAMERWLSHQIDCRCDRVSVKRVSAALTVVPRLRFAQRSGYRRY